MPFNLMLYCTLYYAKSLSVGLNYRLFAYYRLRSRVLVGLR